MSPQYEELLSHLQAIQPLLNTLSEPELTALADMLSEDDVSEAHDISERLRYALRSQ